MLIHTIFNMDEISNKTLEEFIYYIKGKISLRALARICNINEALFLQYTSGKKPISNQTINILNSKIHEFAKSLERINITK